MRIIIEVDDKTAAPPHAERLAPSSAVIGGVEHDESGGAAPSTEAAPPEAGAWSIMAAEAARAAERAMDAGAAPGGAEGDGGVSMPSSEVSARAAVELGSAAAIDAGVAPGGDPQTEDEIYGAESVQGDHEASAGGEAPQLP